MRVFLKAHDPITFLTVSSSHTEILHITSGSVNLEVNRRKRHIWQVANVKGEVCARHLHRCHLYAFCAQFF